MQIMRMEKEFEIKNIGEYHDVQGNTLLLAEVFKNF